MSDITEARKIRFENLREYHRILIEESQHILHCPKCQQRLVDNMECLDEEREFEEAYAKAALTDNQKED